MKSMNDRFYLVSACLLGLATRYDGGHNRNEAVLDFCRRHYCIPVCPEQLGGLPTPRPAAEICGGGGASVLDGKAGVRTADGRDVTASFWRGALQVLQLVRLIKPCGAVLKSGSPSCGSGRIYDGSFRRRAIAGDGVTAALLKRHGIPVFSELSLPPRR
ncbi:MAG: DUF523 domain-containing protein [Firmicutes bacterium]|nr:DUF523 domain-containing protein [Bacillota bacterium]